MLQKKSLIIYIMLTSNNIFYTITDLKGNVKFWSSLGNKKIKSTKKITLNAIKLSLTDIFFIANLHNDKIHFIFKGIHKYKKFIIKYIKQLDLNILSICDYTVSAHNGCKLKKKRRL